MRLLNTHTLELSRLFVPKEVPDYVILSHRWYSEEVTYADIAKAPISDPESLTRSKSGFAKILGACELALQHGYEWIWIDSCCIDKSSSAELQESINSMWRYYEESNICYVYMADVPDARAGHTETFGKSEWFKRGWTLQELIAPVSMEFYAADWRCIGTRYERHEEIAEITSINREVLALARAIGDFSAAQKLSWAAHRKVTRDEDEAYSLLGLFQVNMPLLYGEGREAAFARFQEVVYNSTTDQSMFLHRYSLFDNGQPLLANSPSQFCERWHCTCILGKMVLPLTTQYADVLPSELWTNGAHEHILLTVFRTHSEMSTRLPLLPYEIISDKLHLLDGPGPVVQDATHVVVLNHTLREFPEGALCLLVHKNSRWDNYTRLQHSPVILHRIKGWRMQLQKTKLLIVSCPKFLDPDSSINVEFCLRSSWGKVKDWIPMNCAEKNTRLGIPRDADRPALFGPRKLDASRGEDAGAVVCRIVGLRDSKLAIDITLIERNNMWSIQTICSQQKRHHKQQTENPESLLFSSGRTFVDRCSIKLQSKEALSVELRRLPGSARSQEGRGVIRYQLSVNVV